MTIEQFFAKYANAPLKDRELDTKNHSITLNEIYLIVKEYEDKMRPMRLEQNELIKRAERLFK